MRELRVTRLLRFENYLNNCLPYRRMSTYLPYMRGPRISHLLELKIV